MAETKTITMTVVHVHHPEDGNRGWIKGTDGKIIGVFVDKIGMFEKGRTYNIDYTEAHANGKTYMNFKSAVPAAAAPRMHTGSNGAASPAPDANPAPRAPAGDGGYYRPTAPQDAKRMFVCANLTAFIRAGKVENTKTALWATTQLLCQTWDHTFGEGTTFRVDADARQARG